MLFYFLVFFFLAACTVLDYVRDADQLKKFWYGMIVFFFILLAGLRWETGTDWNNYLTLFKSATSWQELVDNKLFEQGYKLINFGIRSLSEDYTYFLLFCALIIIGLKTAFFFKHTQLFFLAAFLYYSYFFFDIFFVRQSIAISILLWSSIYIHKRKFIPFILLVYLGSLFHGSALLFIIAYFIYNIRFKNSTIIIAVLISIFLSVLSIDVYVLNLVLKVIGGNELIASKMEAYLEVGKGETYGAAVGKGTVLILGILKRGMLIPIFLWFRSKIDEMNTAQYNGYLNFFILGSILYFLTSNYMALQRVSTYFTLYEMLLILMIVQYLNGKVERKITYTLVILYALTKFYYGFAGYKDLYVPYYSIFDTDIQRVVY